MLERRDIRPHLGLWLSLQPEKPPERKDEGTRYETCSWVTTSGFSHICPLSFTTDTPQPSPQPPGHHGLLELQSVSGSGTRALIENG